MDQNEKTELQSKAAFARLRNTEIEPSPFFKQRVLANLPQEKPGRSELWFWRATAASALCAFAVLAVVHFTTPRGPYPQVFSNEAYVVQLDLSGEGMKTAQVAEIILPEDVKFVSKSHPEISELRSLKLPVNVALGRLPFVVKSDRAGLKDLKVRILGVDGAVLEERTVSVSFTDKRAT
jgi:hypothetical protein